MRWALAFCLGFLTTMAQAQTVAIRSGEHAEFSRLTMNLPSRPNWQIEASETGARLIINQPNLTLDPSSVFTRIPRDRLTDLSWQALATFQMRMTRSVHLSLGMRFLGTENRSGQGEERSETKILTAGPSLGVVFRF